MKIALLSDIHANLPALDAVARDLMVERPDAVYCLGNLVNHGLFPNEVIEWIRHYHMPCNRNKLMEALVRTKLSNQLIKITNH